jgi:hypothetical protein
MTFVEFQDYLITHLWKQGDTVVIANLPTLIRTANHELNRKFKVEDRNRMADAQAIDYRVALPSDYRSMVALSSHRRGGMTYVSQHRYAGLLPNARSYEQFYTLANGELRVLGEPSASAPFDLTMAYYANIPDFQTEGYSWVAEKYLDVYLYCTLKHSAPFLREDERITMWAAMYDDALNSALEENAHDVKYGGSPLQMQIGSGVA